MAVGGVGEHRGLCKIDQVEAAVGTQQGCHCGIFPSTLPLVTPWPLPSQVALLPLCGEERHLPCSSPASERGYRRRAGYPCFSLKRYTLIVALNGAGRHWEMVVLGSQLEVSDI